MEAHNGTEMSAANRDFDTVTLVPQTINTLAYSPHKISSFIKMIPNIFLIY